MSHEATRRPGQEPKRHAVGITRTCLASGTMQLPFALAGTLPQGEVLVHDAEAAEAIVLWSEPPRQLAGLAPFFERHELSVNDAVVLEIDGDEIRMTASKRPRRARPVVQPSTWTSVHDDAPEADPASESDADPPHPQATEPSADLDEAAFLDGPPTARRDAAPSSPRDGRPGDLDAGRFELGPERSERPMPIDAAAVERSGETGEPIDDAFGRPAGPPSRDEREDLSAEGPPEAAAMPRAPRVTVKPADRSTTSAGRPLPKSASMPEGRGPFAGLRRLTRSLFGRGGRRDDSGSDRNETPEAPDWTRAWDAPDEEDGPAPVFSPSEPGGSEARQEAARQDAPRRDDVRRDEAFTAAAVEDEADDLEPAQPVAPSSPPPATRVPWVKPDDARPFEADDEADDEPDDEPDAAEAIEVGDDEFGPTPLFPEAAPPRGPVRRPVDETPSGVPPRAERFLEGDLRTRLLRYLASPEMGAVAKVEHLAKRFDLDEATTASLLNDIADDPPEGLRLRRVRDGAWRIERTLGR